MCDLVSIEFIFIETEKECARGIKSHSNWYRVVRMRHTKKPIDPLPFFISGIFFLIFHANKKTCCFLCLFIEKQVNNSLYTAFWVCFKYTYSRFFSYLALPWIITHYTSLIIFVYLLWCVHKRFRWMRSLRRNADDKIKRKSVLYAWKAELSSRRHILRRIETSEYRTPYIRHGS